MSRVFIVGYFILEMVSYSFAQKEDYQWVFHHQDFGCDSSSYGEYCGASILDFNYDPPKVKKNIELTLDLFRTYALMCDEDGQLLFYSNGQSIHNSQGQAINNGEQISYGPKWEEFTWRNELGEKKPIGFRFNNSALIMRNFADNDYLLFYSLKILR